MVTILSRSRWTTTTPKGKAITWSRVRGIVCHYPAAGADIGVLTMEQEAARLRGWRNYHVGMLGWADIGYNYAIGQSGRIYTLRGDRVGGHCYGHNSTTLGVLFIVGDNEELTPAAKASFRALRATLRNRGASSGVWGHTEMSGNSTRCPGPKIMRNIRSGELTGTPVAAAPKVDPTDLLHPWRTSTRVKGMSAEQVRTIQAAVGVKVDGKYGDATGGAVKALQEAVGLTADGIYGPTTEDEMTKLDDISKKLDALPKLVWGIGGGPHAPMINRRFEKGKEYPETTLGSMTDRIIRQQIVPLRGEVAGLAKAVEQIGKGEPVDLDAVRAAARAGVTDALGDVTADVQVTVKGD